MNETPYTDKLLEKENWFIVLLQGVDDESEEVFHYLAVKGGDFDKFMEEQGRGQYFNPEDYGVVINSGPDIPSTAFKTRIIRTFKLAQVA